LNNLYISAGDRRIPDECEEVTTVKFTMRYPMQTGCDPRLFEPGSLARVALAAEAAGFGAIAFTEHPAPSAKWLSNGGHLSFDPLTSLAFVAGVTHAIRLMTYLLVLPYRNPLLLAKQIATLDVLSGGRLTIAAGTGYLRSEYAALGVEFDERNDLFDECAEVLTTAWTQPSYRFSGRHFTALDQALRPAPAQLPHPPLWIGGNSSAARARAARFGQGWTPLIMDEQRAQTTRTPPLTSVRELATAIGDVRRRAAEAARDGAGLDVQVQWAAIDDIAAGYESIADAAWRLAEAGATWAVFEPPGDDLEHTLDVVRVFGAEVIAVTRTAN
jgi:probable F420-dependent oxidoreductase